MNPSPMDYESILEVKDLKKYYPLKKFLGPTQYVKALDGVNFSLKKRETLGIVGESGCGKSTLAKILLQIESLTSGSVSLMGTPLQNLPRKDLCHHIQMVFQDPYSSLNPRKKAWQIVAEPLSIHTKLTSKECRQKAFEIMNKVGLSSSAGERYPHMFSGGQRQRIGLARALVLRPKILCLDEPVSALDVSIQAQVINLLMEIQEEFDLSYIFISHDLSVVKHISDRILVMYLGKAVEYATCQKLFATPLHPYTQALLKATPSLHQKVSWDTPPLMGELPSPLRPPPGCAFHKRCPLAEKTCEEKIPSLQSLAHDHLVACHLVGHQE